MLKKIITAVIFGSIVFTAPILNAKTGDKTLERPSSCGASSIDAYATKAFDAYDESKGISKDIEFIKVEVKEIPPTADGVTTELKITNGNGEQLSKATALTQFGQLLLRTTKQSENIQTLVSLQQPAANELKTVAPLKKPKAAKTMAVAGDAQAFVLNETKTQIELINQQISTLKALKNN